MQQTTISKSPRVEVVDALRGFAVLAILLVHNVEHFIYPVYPDPATLPGWLNVLNEGVFTVVFALFAGKSYSIFALLFGFTFYIQYSNQQAKGKDFGYRFLWRLLLLTIFATLNAAFYPAGDVLLLYAIVGVVLFIVRKWSDKAVLITAIIFLLQPVEWYHYIASLFNPDYQLPNLGVGEMYSEMAEHTKRGDLWNFIWQNVTLGQKASLLCWCRPVCTDLRVIYAGNVDRAQKVIYPLGGEFPFLDKDLDHYCDRFRSFIPTESIVDGYGGQRYRAPDGRCCV